MIFMQDEVHCQQRNAEYRAFLDTIPCYVLENDPSGRITFCNRAYLAMLGYAEGELIGKSTWDLLPSAADKTDFKNHLFQLTEKQPAPTPFVTKNKTKDGNIIDIEVRWDYVRDSSGRLLGFISFVNDITSQRLAQEERLLFDEQYRTITATAKDAIIMMDDDGRIVFWNPAAEKIFGYSQEEALGEVLHLFLTPSQYHEFYRKGISQFRECGTGPAVGKTIELMATRKDGCEFPIELSLSAIRNGKKWHAIGIVRDITERKLAEEELAKYRSHLEEKVQERTVELMRVNEQLKQEIEERKRAEEAMLDSQMKYRALVEDSRDAIYMVSRDGTFLDVNKATIDLFGYTSEEIIGMNVLSLYVNPADRYRFQEEIERHGSVRDYEVRLKKKGGQEMVCLATFTLRRDIDGKILGYQGILRDITEKRKIEAEMLKIEKLESISILAGGIAHDFNNILTAILGNFAIAKAQSKPGEIVFDRLAAAEKAALRANDLTRQFLIFAQGGSPIKARFSVADLLQDSAKLTLRRNKVRCEFSIAEDLCPVEGDSSQISQVIHNLLINADQAMPKGGTVTIKAENINVGINDLYPLQKGQYVKITVEDEGIGIPPQNLKKIFDPYFTTKEMGSGLGLAVTYSVVKKHGGYIDVESTPGRGSCFSLYLPVSDAEPSVWERYTTL